MKGVRRIINSDALALLRSAKGRGWPKSHQDQGSSSDCSAPNGRATEPRQIFLKR